MPVPKEKTFVEESRLHVGEELHKAVKSPVVQHSKGGRNLELIVHHEKCVEQRGLMMEKQCGR